jgi:fatty acid desaturase
VASRSSRSDSVFIALTAAHAAALVFVPSVPVVAVGLWWNANTIAHNFIHRPFFRRRAANRAFSAVLSLVLGVPQALWRARHLAHHADTPGGGARPKHPRLFSTAGAWIDVAIVVALFATLAIVAPWFLITVYLPGWLLGLAICHIHGHYEHAHGTTSHYGRLYNFLFFNDGYHVEHHARPHVHWRDLPSASAAPGSRWPAALRWLDAVSLAGLERLVLRSAWLQKLVVDAHARAIARLLPSIGAVERVTIVGGGLFPRTAIVMRRLRPDARLTIVDSDLAHLESARALAPAGVHLIHATYDHTWRDDAHLIVVPLAFDGDRALEYASPRAPAVLVHDWIWRRRGSGVVVAWWLFKRVNLVLRETSPAHDSVFECARPAW